jgi:hypothetical protein
VSSDILDLVTLYLYDNGPATFSDIAATTLIPRASLRSHLHLNDGYRYRCELAEVDGIPTRRWSLLPPTMVVHDDGAIE